MYIYTYIYICIYVCIYVKPEKAILLLVFVPGAACPSVCHLATRCAPNDQSPWKGLLVSSGLPTCTECCHGRAIRAAQASPCRLYIYKYIHMYI